MARLSSMKGLHLLLAAFLLLGLSACRKVYKCPEVDGYTDPFTQDTVYYDTSTKEFTFKAVYHSYPAVNGSWHAFVHKEGQNGTPDKTPFSTGITPWQFYCVTKELGGVDLNAVSRTNSGLPDTFTTGTRLDISVTWQGAARTYDLVGDGEFLQEIIPENSPLQQKFGFEARYGGNRTTHDEGNCPADITGCVVCLFSCPSPPASGATINGYMANTLDKTYRYRANPDVVPADGTVCTITVKVRTDLD